MTDKFWANLPIVLPAAVIVFLGYVLLGFNIKEPAGVADVNVMKVLPYIIVLVTAIMGMNVLAVLALGILSCIVIGLLDGSYDVFGMLTAMGDGIMTMSELIIVTILAAGMLAVIKQAGGIRYIIELMTRHIHGKRGAEMSIGFLVALVDICTANNTIAILTVGDISKDISEKYDVDPRRAASILDTFSCAMQGLIPYGAQVLIAAGLAKINPIEIVPYLYYTMMMGIMGVLCILFRFPKKYS